MEAKSASAFLSHSSHDADRECAGCLAAALTESGVETWWDEGHLTGATEFPAKILEAIVGHNFFVYIISPRSVISDWCERELTFAANVGKQIIPLLLEEVPPSTRPIILANLQHVDIRQGIPRSLDRILSAMGLSYRPGQQVPEDRGARDGRLLHAIAAQLRYAKNLPISLNIVQLLKNLGLDWCETERARLLFDGMTRPANYTGGRIDYDKVRDHLLRGWKFE